MDLLKALKRTTFLSAATAMAVFALGATEANALGASGSGVSYLGHCTASVTSLLTVTEVSQIQFGNVAVATGSDTDSDTLTLALDGSRTVTGSKLTALTGGVAGTGHITAGSGVTDTGGGAVGVYEIQTGAEGPTQVYVNFATNTGAIMDANHGELPSNTTISPDHVDMTNGTDHFAVDHFVIGSETTQPGSTPYGGTAPVSQNGETYSQFVPCAGASCFVRVGASMHTNVASDASAYSVGHYEGTFYIMVSY